MILLLLLALCPNLAYAEQVERFAEIEDFDEANRIDNNLDGITDESRDIPTKVDGAGVVEHNVLDVQTVLKLSGNWFINEDFSRVKPDGDVTTDIVIAKHNRKLEPFYRFRPSIESRLKFNLYDDIRLDVPILFSYEGFYPQLALDQLNTQAKEMDQKLARIVDIKIGFWFDWYAVSFFKIGLRGGHENILGHAFVIKNKIYNDKNGVHEKGFDVIDYNVLLFNEFLVRPVSWFSFEPEIRLGVEKGYLSPGDTKMADVIFYVKLLLPVKFEFRFIDTLKLKLKSEISGDKAFSGTGNIDNGKIGALEGYGLLAKQAIELEYKLLKFAAIRIPLSFGYCGRFFEDDSVTFNPSMKLSTAPSIEVDLELFRGLFLIVDTELFYEFFTVKFTDSFIETNWSTSPVLKWGVGFRYNSTSH